MEMGGEGSPSNLEGKGGPHDIISGWYFKYSFICSCRAARSQIFDDTDAKGIVLIDSVDRLAYEQPEWLFTVAD